MHCAKLFEIASKEESDVFKQMDKDTKKQARCLFLCMSLVPRVVGHVPGGSVSRRSFTQTMPTTLTWLERSARLELVGGPWGREGLRCLSHSPADLRVDVGSVQRASSSPRSAPPVCRAGEMESWLQWWKRPDKCPALSGHAEKLHAVGRAILALCGRVEPLEAF